HLLAAVSDENASRPDSLRIFDVRNRDATQLSSYPLLKNVPDLRDTEYWPCIRAAASFDAPYCIAAARGHFEIFRIVSGAMPRLELTQSFTWNVAMGNVHLSPNGKWLLLLEEKGLYIVCLEGSSLQPEGSKQPVRTAGAQPVPILYDQFNEPISAAGFRGNSTIEVLLAQSGLREYQIPAPRGSVL